MRPYLAALIAVAGAALAADPPARQDVVPALQRGGYVLFVRHPQTDPDQADTDPLNLDNVKAQRQLTGAGRVQARRIGEALRALHVPVGRVVASKFYRAREAAGLLGVGEVEAALDVTEGGQVVSPNENRRRAEALRGLLGAAPAAGTNTVIVSHRPNLQDAAGKEFGDLGEGEAVVFEPLGGGKFRAMARIAPATWSEWAR